MDIETLAAGPLWYAAFLLSITCHEAAHALAAKWGGDLTAYEAGQVTLNPVPHIQREPFGTVLVPIISFIANGSMFGWASAPFDPHWAIRHPRRAAWMALAGPIANIALAIFAGVLIRLTMHFDLFSEGLALFLSILFALNLLLAVFNLIPMPPLDGFSVLGLALPEDITLQLFELRANPLFQIVGLLVSIRIVHSLYPPVYAFALHYLHYY
jgi:Zn-dependent protease